MYRYRYPMYRYYIQSFNQFAIFLLLLPVLFLALPRPASLHSPPPVAHPATLHYLIPAPPVAHPALPHPPPLLPTLCQADKEACTVVLDLEEKNWYNLKAGTYIQVGGGAPGWGAGVGGQADNNRPILPKLVCSNKTIHTSQVYSTQVSRLTSLALIVSSP